jgi:hypothetical protein
MFGQPGPGQGTRGKATPRLFLCHRPAENKFVLAGLIYQNGDKQPISDIAFFFRRSAEETSQRVSKLMNINPHGTYQRIDTLLANTYVRTTL